MLFGVRCARIYEQGRKATTRTMQNKPNIATHNRIKETKNTFNNSTSKNKSTINNLKVQNSLRQIGKPFVLGSYLQDLISLQEFPFSEDDDDM